MKDIPQPPEFDPDAEQPESPLRGNICVARTRNKDKSSTFYLRWRLHTGERFCQRLFRTEANPTRGSMREWRRKAAEAAHETQEQIAGHPDRPARTNFRLALPRAVDWYLSWIRGDEYHPPQRSESTCDRQERLLAEFIGYVNRTWPRIRRVNQLSLIHIAGQGKDQYGNAVPVGWRHWRANNGIAESTIRTELSDISAFLKFAYDSNWMTQKLHFVRPKIEPQSPVILTDERVRYILDFDLPAHKRMTFLLLAATGMRQGELRALNISAFNSETAEITIPTGEMERTKRHGRSIPLGPKVARELGTWLGHRLEEWMIHTNGHRVATQINRWFKVFGHKPHDLRRWFINTLHKEGCPQLWIDRLVGHAPRNVDAQSYVNPTREDLRGWVAKLEERLLP